MSLLNTTIATCPEIPLESVATQTYCKSLLYILLELYSKITKIVPAILDSFFKWSTALSEMHQVRGRVGGRWGAGAEQPTQIESRK